MRKLIITLLLCLFIAGCSDVVGEPEFVCPICGSNEAQLHSRGENTWLGFHFHCGACGTKSGEYESFTKAIKTWKLN
jgi:hypothetical protein